MKTRDRYLYIKNNREKGVDSVPTVDKHGLDNQTANIEQAAPLELIAEASQDLPDAAKVQVPDSISPELAEEYLEREAILVIDGGLDEKSAAVQAEQEILARYKPQQRKFVAECCILWGAYHRDKWASETDRRVYCEGIPQKVCVELEGVDRADALSKLKTNAYEFIEWWS